MCNSALDDIVRYNEGKSLCNLLSSSSALQKPDIPSDEVHRLETLRSLNILDTPPEERFDRLTRTAKRLFGVPIVQFTLVDENRQWFKSCVGLNVQETPRDISFCGHAILDNSLFIIPDATKDKRFADNPLVLNDPHIRFYAGCPLKAPNGKKIGVLCIADREPRSFTAEDLEALKDLASMAERELLIIQLATMDDLTNISNRRGFMMLAQHLLNFCKREKTLATLLFMDLDKFKNINDTFGHAEGDKALSAFACLMKAESRESDIFGRLGGDEFAAFLVNTSKKHAETFIIPRFQQSLEKYNRETNRGYDISFSYGIVEFDPEKPRTIKELLADADYLMYELKREKLASPVKEAE